VNLSAGKKIIFDMDGVITGEERYWDAAALTVWELIFSERFLNIEAPPGLPAFKTGPSLREIAAVRRVIFCEDQVISFFKQRAVNSNWDLAFLTFSFQLLSLTKYLAGRGVSFKDLYDGRESGFEKGITTGELSLMRSSLTAAGGDGWKPSFQDVLTDWAEESRGGELMKKLRNIFPPGFGQIFGKGGNAPSSSLWKGTQEIFQEWYFGEQVFKVNYGKEPGVSGKEGLICREEPLLRVSAIKAALSELKRLGWKLGIATGRPMNELYHPLEQMDIWKYFDTNSVVTFDKVTKVEKILREDFPLISLGKPHPYSFLKAYWGEEKSDRELASAAPPLPQQGMCWVIGDALADLLAAREAGASFIGVLTGHNGSNNKELFKNEGAEAILPDITCLPEFFTKDNL